MNPKSTFTIYFNNTIAFILFSILRFTLPKGFKGNNILFINTGQIGDLMISTVIINNIDSLTDKGRTVYFLLKEEYTELYSGFGNKIKLIPWNYKKYKYNLFYRVRFLISLRSLNLKYCFNLTAARGVTVDELALLSGAEKIYALNSNFKYLEKLFGIQLDKLYSNILAKSTNNEYEKHLEVLKIFSETNSFRGTTLTISPDKFSALEAKLNFDINTKYIVISPFSDSEIKNWSANNFHELVTLILKNFSYLLIILIGKGSQRSRIAKLFPEASQILNLAGELTISESAIIVKNASIFIGNDSGFTHIAKAFQINTIALIGGGSNGYFLPYNVKNNEYYFYHQTECFRCEWRCKHKRPYCLTEISVISVYKTIEELLYEHS